MNPIDNVQTGLSKLQAIPVAGPLIFSPVKAGLSHVQMIAGFALGIFAGMAATAAAIVGADRLAGRLADISVFGFAESIKGFGSLFYACANMATLGILGLCVELSRSREVTVIYCGPHHHHHRSWFAVRTPGVCY